MIRIPAPAKLNLFLQITGKRADGYHLIESLAGFTDFGDWVEVSDAPELALLIDGPFAALLQGDNNNNLVLKAARALQRHCRITRGAHIHLHKAIPIGAGLGGGSSDAAAALKTLIELWQLSIPEPELHTIALSLGSDVPVCLLQKTAWISGIGEQVLPVAMMVECWVLLVNPNIPLLTADVYQKFSGVFSPASQPLASISSLNHLVGIMQSRHNALEAPAISLLPAIAGILSALRSTDGCRIARMSGSGATCYALYDSQAQAQRAAEMMQVGWWAQVTRFLV